MGPSSPVATRLWSSVSRRPRSLAWGAIVALTLALLSFSHSSHPGLPDTLPEIYNSAYEFTSRHALSRFQRKDHLNSSHGALTMQTMVAPEPMPPMYRGKAIDFTKLAWIVETRLQTNFLPLLLHMIEVVPPEWPFRIVAIPAVFEMLRQSPSVQYLESEKKIEFKELDVAVWDLTETTAMRDQMIISEALTDLDFFDEYIGTEVEHLFVWQTDAVLCANAPKTINDYLEYDWVGSPWNLPFSGNGGLCMRKMSLMREVLARTSRPKGDIYPYEDWWWRERLLERPDHNMANESVAVSFSVSPESPFHPNPLGYHLGRDGNYLLGQFRSADVYNAAVTYCPEAKMIFKVRPP